jgi:hypothetical protein
MSWPPQHGDQNPPQYGQPQYGQQPYAQPYSAAAPGTNMMAILSLVFAFVFAPAGIVLGHIAKRQLKTSGENGAGLASAGLVLSYIFTGLAVLACCAGVALAIFASPHTASQ